MTPTPDLPWNSLQASNLNKRTATLGLPRPSSRKVNTRQYRFSFATLNTSVVDTANYYLIDQPGMAFGLNNASDDGACAIVHVNEPGNPVYITPGTPKDIPEGFSRLLLERPTQPNVPSRADLFMIFDLSDKVGGVQYGPLPPRAAKTGMDNYTAPGEVFVTKIIAVDTPQLAIAAEPGRRSVVIMNTSLGGESIYVTLDSTTGAQDRNSGGMIAFLAPGERTEVFYTGAVGMLATANTARALVFGLK